MHQAHDQTIRDASLKQIAFVEFQLIGGVGKHMNLTSHGTWQRRVDCVEPCPRSCTTEPTGSVDRHERSSPDPGGSDVRVIPRHSKRSQDC